LAPKKPFSQETAPNKEKRILYFHLRILSAIQIYLKYCKVPKSLDPNTQVKLDGGRGEKQKCRISDPDLLVAKTRKMILDIVPVSSD
jgi:hypothetical protein